MCSVAVLWVGLLFMCIRCSLICSVAVLCVCVAVLWVGFGYIKLAILIDQAAHRVPIDRPPASMPT